MVIDTNNKEEMQKYEKLKEELIEKKLEKGFYTSEDVVLVRVADHFPKDGFVPSISNVPFVAKMNDLAFEAIDTIFKEQGLSWLERKEQSREYSPLSTQYRSSSHFCLNGIVSSHIYGNFDGRPFVIIEPFKRHEDDNNILAVRGEDTYFKDGLSLSNDAIILVDEAYADKVLDFGTEEKNIVFYNGDQKKATEVVLINMGIVPEKIGDNYIIDSKTSNFIREFISRKNYPQEKHCFSESYREDDIKTLELWEKYANNYYNYLYNCVYGSAEGKEEEISYLVTATPYNNIAVEHLKGMIKDIGIDKYKEIVETYNNSILEKVAIGQYPTNNQILEGEPFGYSGFVVHK